jgi:hypothetical protein
MCSDGDWVDTFVVTGFFFGVALVFEGAGAGAVDDLGDALADVGVSEGTTPGEAAASGTSTDRGSAEAC